MNIKEKLENLLDAMNDALTSVSSHAEDLEESIDKIFEVEEFIEQNGIYIAGFDAQDIAYDLRYGFLDNDTDVAYVPVLLIKLMHEIENYEDYEELYYTLTDVFNNLDTSVIEIKDINDYLEILKMQIDTVKSELSNWN